VASLDCIVVTITFFAQDYVEPSPADENEEDEAAVTSAEASEESTGGAAVAAPERKVNFQKVGVTEVSSCRTFFAQRVEDGKRKIMDLFVVLFISCLNSKESTMVEKLLVSETLIGETN